MEKSLLRLTTSGSVDDGKSTLIGRLLFETKCVYEDQLAAVHKASQKKGLAETDLALLLDGLAAEREQGITIDVAYRYFETPKRKFIIADCPGHEQYTRNMVTGASTAQLALILIDARNGVLTQSKRHGFLVSLLQIPHLVVAVNKMDLMDYREDVYNDIVAEYSAFSEKLDIHDITYIPVSALKGDNVVDKSPNMTWYQGFPLLKYLESVHVAADHNLVDFRFPVQYVIRPHLDFRGYAGRVSSGTVRVGEEIAVLPSGKTSRVRGVTTFDGELDEAFVTQSVVLSLEDEIDISRGDMIVRKNNLPEVGNRVEAIICWMSEEASSESTAYILKHTTKNTKAFISKINYKIDVNTLHREQAGNLTLNEIARVEIRTAQPLFFDAYDSNRATGSFILIDPHTNLTVAGGMIRSASRDLESVTAASLDQHIARKSSTNVTWQSLSTARRKREDRQGHRAAVLWLTGYSGSGKSTIAKALEKRLFDMGCSTMLLDGDNVRHGLCGDLGFSDRDRTENIRRVGEVAKLFFENGALAICTFISPFREDRDFVRGIMEPGRFFEVFVKCDLEVCKRRDPRGLYKKAAAGEIKQFTGIDSPYEEPVHPELTVETDLESADQIVESIIGALREKGILGG
ncbi:MAG: sulfate adenylyltransferase subunit CysN [Chitinivibrionales bacterium]|nr:sulfate adenylyltransferase subunit CysN [Chitinivibrionales bacterium]MBD3396317.1 sulfate adenylyltransferase subunit CysN [Chitinivibrionales bacterium]